MSTLKYWASGNARYDNLTKSKNSGGSNMTRCDMCGKEISKATKGVSDHDSPMNVCNECGKDVCLGCTPSHPCGKCSQKTLTHWTSGNARYDNLTKSKNSGGNNATRCDFCKKEISKATKGVSDFDAEMYVCKKCGKDVCMSCVKSHNQV